jgi:hypothetical protein
MAGLGPAIFICGWSEIETASSPEGKIMALRSLTGTSWGELLSDCFVFYTALFYPTFSPYIRDAGNCSATWLRTVVSRFIVRFQNTRIGPYWPVDHRIYKVNLRGADRQEFVGFTSVFA